MTQIEIENILDEIVRRIVERFHPEKIILFGSYARNESTADSDADLLIIMRVSGSKRRQAVEIDFLLQGIPIPTDVIVVSPEEVGRSCDCPGTIIYEAIREGKVLYERAA
jgi:predicted nucleotidyltransferase